MKVSIREVRAGDLDCVASIEKICFPPAEAAQREAFQKRIITFPESFFVAENGEGLVGFINGCATNSTVIYDELFHNAQHHIANGENLAIFGLDVLPKYRHQGIAAQLMKHFIQMAKDTRRKKILLTCKSHLICYYATFGFMNNGLSCSTHGGAEWYDMSLTL